MNYAEFLASKERATEPIGRDVNRLDVHPMLHDWQAEIVVWAVGVGRAAVWADTGLGKTLMQIEWARLSADTSLIVAPLAVCQQTVREARKVGVTATYVRSPEQITGRGMFVTNYEMVQHFPPAMFGAVVLDESSILKNSSGATRTMLIEHFRTVPRRLSCTATPAPNDPEELTNQAEFLGVMPRVEMLAAYFVHDSDTGWRLKGHARGPMFRWMASWAIAIRRPSDFGYSDDGYDLPGLVIREHLLDVDAVPDGQLFATDLGGVGGRAAVRKATLAARCDRVIALINESHGWQQECDKLMPNLPSKAEAVPSAGPPSVMVPVDDSQSTTVTRAAASAGSSALSATSGSVSSGTIRGYSPGPSNTSPVEPWVVWCGLNDEQDYLSRAFGDRAFSISGGQSVDEKTDLLYRWIDGERPILLTKASIAGFGLNMQHCARTAFVGLSDSYETYYQAIRRFHRYGQTRVVHAHVVLSALEGQIAANVRRKEHEASRSTDELVAAIRAERGALVA